jgi:DNA-binding beta-propeller fold protein YncE
VKGARRGLVPAALACALIALAVGASPGTAAKGKGKPKGKPSPTKSMIFVGNNWDGTVDVINRKNFRRVGRINIIPDRTERMNEIALNPVDLGYFLGIRQLVGEGNDQFADDMYSVLGGTLLVISRPSFKDVVGIDMKTGQVRWRFEVAGQRSDHMAISPDGRHVAVSASTGNVVHVLDTATGQEVGRWQSGDSPHENTYIDKGRKIIHASIGLVYTPADQPQVDTSKGKRVLQVVDAKTFKVLSEVNMGEKLKEAGYPNMSAAVRPMAVAPKERIIFLQVSFFHGFVVYDLKAQKVLKVVKLPVAEKIKDLPKEEYLLDSAHHGIAIDKTGRKLCVAGTMSDYVALVRRGSFTYKLFNNGLKPYWSTTSANGKQCYVSWSGTDAISVFSYKKMKEVARIPVGDHPQRIRTGKVRRDVLAALRAG